MVGIRTLIWCISYTSLTSKRLVRYTPYEGSKLSQSEQPEVGGISPEVGGKPLPI